MSDQDAPVRPGNERPEGGEPVRPGGQADAVRLGRLLDRLEREYPPVWVRMFSPPGEGA